MCAKDLARVGLLVATRGIWNGERLISDSLLLRGHRGHGNSVMNGWSNHNGKDLFMSVGITATRDMEVFDAEADVYADLVEGPVRTKTQAIT